MGKYFYVKILDIISKIIAPPPEHSKKYKVAICAVFKNESKYLKEWIEFHKIIGIEHFYLYNNNSNDQYKNILKPYVDKGDVTLKDWPYNQQQREVYQDCIKNFRNESNWIGFIDIDEFVVPIEHDNIYEFLKKFKNKGSVLLYWKMYGSSGLINRDTEILVSESFLYLGLNIVAMENAFITHLLIFVLAVKKYLIYHT